MTPVEALAKVLEAEEHDVRLDLGREMYDACASALIHDLRKRGFDVVGVEVGDND